MSLQGFTQKGIKQNGHMLQRDGRGSVKQCVFVCSLCVRESFMRDLLPEDEEYPRNHPGKGSIDGLGHCDNLFLAEMTLR